MPRPTLLQPAAGVLLAVLVAASVGCGGGEGSRQAATGPCASLGGEQYAMAVDEFLKDINPAPLRFLTTTGDSAVPSTVVDALQDKGPTFIYPTDPAQQKAVLASLEQKGAYPTLLVLYGGTTRDATGATVVRFTGRFVDKGDASVVAPLKAMTFQCRENRWQLVSAKVDQAS